MNSCFWPAGSGIVGSGAPAWPTYVPFDDCRSSIHHRWPSVVSCACRRDTPLSEPQSICGVMLRLTDRRPTSTLRMSSGTTTRMNNPLCLPENLERAGSLIDALRRVASTHGATPAQVALAWLIRKPNVVAIPGASSVDQLRHNIEAADLDLTDAEVEELGAESDRFTPLNPVEAAVGRFRPRRTPA